MTKETTKKVIDLLERLERECMVPEFAHDAFGSCPLCRLLEEIKTEDALLFHIK